MRDYARIWQSEECVFVEANKTSLQTMDKQAQEKLKQVNKIAKEMFQI